MYNDAGRGQVAIDQCLFGYRQGHRLLASSRSIPRIVVQSLQGRTDATLDARSDATLLQGFPVTGLNAYAIARTWPDRREDARSGTVLTHLLLVKLPDIGIEGIIEPLILLLQDDPNYQIEDSYTRLIELDEAQWSRPIRGLTLFSSIDVPGLLEQLYRESSKNTVVFKMKWGMRGRSPAAEELLACVWEQQWPRLRRSFSFVIREGMPRNVDASGGYPTDLVLTLSVSGEPNLQKTSQSGEAWINAVYEDLLSPGTLRHFLRQVGADLPETRSTMLILAEFFSFTTGVWQQSSFSNLAKRILANYQEESQGRLLKQRLLDGSLWTTQRGFKASEYLKALLDLERQGLNFTPPDWSALLDFAEQQDPQAALNAVVCTLEDDDLPIGESLREAYLSTLRLPQLLPLTEACPSMFHAALKLHPQWLEESRLWIDFRSRPERLASAVSALADQGPSDLNWPIVVENMLDTASGMSSSELLWRLPLNALHRFLEALHTRDVTDTWLQGLNVRKNEVMTWIATQHMPPAQVLLWVCIHLEYVDMWRPALAETWQRVALHISSYSDERRMLFALHALLTMVTASRIDTEALLHVLEVGRRQITDDAITSFQRHYLYDHLPKLPKERDNWDLGRRLDLWAADTLNTLGVSRARISKSFKQPNQASRFLKAIKRK
jgi:hypothetical protein